MCKHFQEHTYEERRAFEHKITGEDETLTTGPSLDDAIQQVQVTCPGENEATDERGWRTTPSKWIMWWFIW